MALEFRHSPFISFSSGNRKHPSIGDVLRVEPSLDLLVQSALGRLYWNKGISSVGLVCGAATNETNVIVRRLIASHMSDPMARVLVLHTDNFYIKSTGCPLLFPMLPRPRILISPHAPDGVTEIYGASDCLAVPIAFNASSVTLGHVLNLFTPSPEMKEHTSILGTIRLILSQLREPFDLQKFIEMVDQENWSEEAANFLALRQTLLTRLLSPTLEEQYEDRQMTVIDLTDAVLRNTGLDSAIMDVALHNFVQSPGGKKLIVLNNSHQYLTAKCSLSKTLETLVSVVGNDRPASLILSTTDPKMVSFPIINTADYVVSTLSRSFQWNAFLQNHFIESEIPLTQKRTGRAMIWSPESIMYKPDTSKDGSEARRLWGRRLSFINIEQFERTMPRNPCINNSVEKDCVDGNGNLPADTNIDDDEEGMVPLDRIMPEEGSDTIAGDEPATLTPVSLQEQANEFSSTLGLNKATSVCPSQATMISQSHPTVDPRHHVPAVSTADIGHPNEDLRTSGSTTIEAFDSPCQPLPIVSAIIGLTSGDANGKVRLINLYDSLLQTYHGQANAVHRLIGEAKKNGIVLQEKDTTGAIWLSINNAANVRPNIRPNLSSFSPPIKPANVKQFGETRPDADMAQPKVEPYSMIEPKSAPPGHDVPNPTASTISIPFAPADIIPHGVKRSRVEATPKGTEPIHSSKASPFGAGVLPVPLAPPLEVAALLPSSPLHAPQSGSTQVLARMISKQPTAMGAVDSLPTPSWPPAASVVATAPSRPAASRQTAPANITAASCPPKHRAVVAMLIALTEGTPGKKVRMEEWMSSLRCEYPGAREAFLLSLIAEAEEDGVMTRRRDKNGVWTWLNPAKVNR